MSLTPTPVCAQQPQQSSLVFGSSYVANTVTACVVAGPNGNKVVSITAVNTDSGAHIVQVWDRENGIDALLTSFSIPASAGSDGAIQNGNALSLWSGLPQDNDAQVYFYLNPSATLGLSLTTTLPVGKNVTLTCTNAKF